MDLRESERKTIKAFFDDNEGYNKIRFAKKYVELLKVDFFKDLKALKWTGEIKKRINNQAYQILQRVSAISLMESCLYFG